MSPATQTRRGSDPFVHEALFYRGSDDFLTGTLRFVHAGLALGEPVLVAVPGPRLEILRDALDTDADLVRFADMTEAGRNPGRILPWVLHAFAAEHPQGRVRVIGEPIWAGRSAVEYPACVQHEALINVVFAGRQATILCPYDVDQLTPDVIADAERTHPILVTASDRRDSAGYTAPDQVVAAFNKPLPSPPQPAATLVFGVSELSGVRHFVVEHATVAGMRPERVIDLEMAVNEVATNSVAHTTGPGTLRVWSENDAVVCEVRDPGQFTNRLAGRVPPPPSSSRGRGLLLVNHVCDLVRLHTGPAGTTIRLHMGL